MTDHMQDSKAVNQHNVTGGNQAAAGSKRKEAAKIISQRQLAPDIYDMWIETSLAADALPGQFIGIYPQNKSTLLPRPLSICEADAGQNALRIVYRVAGKGTAEFSNLKQNDAVEILGILGNGFPVKREAAGKAVLLGGGIGIPPLLELAKALQRAGNEPVIIAGYRDENLFLRKDLEKYGKVYVATEDGSAGYKGNVLTVLKEEKITPGVLMACGPMPMLRAVKAYSEEMKIPAFISLEERMACGVGACLGCVCRTAVKDEHSQVNNARICTDGPVFDAAFVEI